MSSQHQPQSDEAPSATVQTFFASSCINNNVLSQDQNQDHHQQGSQQQQQQPIVPPPKLKESKSSTGRLERFLYWEQTISLLMFMYASATFEYPNLVFPAWIFVVTATVYCLLSTSLLKHEIIFLEFKPNLEFSIQKVFDDT